MLFYIKKGFLNVYALFIRSPQCMWKSVDNVWKSV
ncbi:hypothetical protein SSM2_086 [Synechococcus phage S-SM2]|uniref:Uncharacterized protein n=1 Tax=Synechococcus phage S-SM2 TaxID=444860 RepID=E3SIY0_9CAUD|nr:hypothetical protein SSM2_086 [Synechococcus phage S-SM2]ADO97428.1 hypothetical protein SSM2_086 [Synechococcus phage S-SM2]